MEKLHVLVIDDNRDDRELAAIALRREFPDIVISEANDQNSFEQRLDESVDVVITDYQLRWTTGQQILAETLTRYPGLPVIMFTNTGTEEVCAKAMKTGLFDYIVKKPSHYVKLPAAVRAALAYAETKRKLGQQQEENRRQRQRLQEMNETLEQRVRERTALAEQRAESLRRLARELTEAENRERRRLAEILHEQLQQELFGAQLQIGAIKDAADEVTAVKLEKVASILEQVTETSRNLAVDLTPPSLYQYGLAAALEGLATRLQQQIALAVDVDADRDADPPDDSIRGFLYHSVRELLLNVKKHAGVGKACVVMSRDDNPDKPHLQLEVSDEGCGFNIAAYRDKQPWEEHFGLFSIEQRVEVMGGSFALESQIGKGTRAVLRIPLA